MRSKGTWVFIFYVAATALLAMIFTLATREIFGLLRIHDVYSNLIGSGLALLIAIYTAFLDKRGRNFIEQCIVELDKVAWPSGHETKVATYTVVVVSLIAALILGFFDSIFGWLSHHDFFLG
ncbi:MAG: preprotein translocase subunit SecE [Myxococcaceae bacterium]